jgi:hypothetical protein
VPFVADQHVLIGSERLDALSKAPDEIFRLTSRGLTGYCLHETKHVLGAMIDLAHKQVLPFRALPTLFSLRLARIASGWRAPAYASQGCC